jgi:hypothetical protein
VRGAASVKGTAKSGRGRRKINGIFRILSTGHTTCGNKSSAKALTKI